MAAAIRVVALLDFISQGEMVRNGENARAGAAIVAAAIRVVALPDFILQGEMDGRK